MARPRPHGEVFGRALVTGASSGIGEAFVEVLRAAGVPVVAVARRADRLESLADRLGDVEVLGADLTTPEGLTAVEARIVDDRDPVDLVVNNAAFGTSGPFVTLDVDRLEREVSLNAASLTRLSHAALRAMVPRHRGYLINVSSIAGFQAAPGLAVYAASKAYVTSLSEALHAEVSAVGVHVTALCPGLTRTEFQRVSNTESYVDRFPGFAWSSVDSVAETGLRDVTRGRVVSVPGAVNKVVTGLSAVTPRPLLRVIAARVQRV